MKKILNVLLVFIMLFVCLGQIKAECNDEDLNEWATKVNATFTESKALSSTYAYFLSIAPYRDDIKIIVYDGKGNKAEGTFYESENLYGVGAYTNLEEETYKIEVYGNEKSKCPNELLKTVKYTVPRYNRKLKDKECEKHPELEVCKTFTNSTKDMTDKEFKAQIDSPKKEFKNVLLTVIEYALAIIIPAAIISLIYMAKIKRVKKEERKR